jgi:hypothetical protein
MNVEGLLSDRGFEQVISQRYMWIYLTALESETLLSATIELLEMLCTE